MLTDEARRYQDLSHHLWEVLNGQVWTKHFISTTSNFQWKWTESHGQHGDPSSDHLGEDPLGTIGIVVPNAIEGSRSQDAHGLGTGRQQSREIGHWWAAAEVRCGRHLRSFPLRWTHRPVRLQSQRVFFFFFTVAFFKQRKVGLTHVKTVLKHGTNHDKLRIHNSGIAKLKLKTEAYIWTIPIPRSLSVWRPLYYTRR